MGGLSEFELGRWSIVIPRFEYIKPGSLIEAFRLLDEHKGEAKPVAGATDLLVKMRDGVERPTYLVDLSFLDELGYIREKDGQIRIGALATLSDLVASSTIREMVPILGETAKKMASWHIRNVATIGGNLCNASPAADMAPPLIVLGSKLELGGLEGERVIPTEEFFRGPGSTVLRDNELLIEIRVPVMPEKSGASFQKLSIRETALSTVSAAAWVQSSGGRIEEARIALGAVAPTPIRAKHAESALKGQETSDGAIERASKEVMRDISPITDVRGSKRYREEMSVLLARRALIQALERAR